MLLLVVAALLVLGVLPCAAALGGLVADPGAVLDVLASARLRGLMANTLALGVLTAALSLLVGVPVGALLAARRDRLAALVATLLPLPLVLPPWVAGVAWLRVVEANGVLGAAFLLAVSLWPIVGLFAMRGFARAGSGGEAARLARGPVAAWWRVELPLAAPSIASGALLVFVFAVTDFSVVDLLSFNDPEPFVVFASEIFQRWSRMGEPIEAAAVSVAALLPSLVALAGVLLIERRHAGQARGPLGATAPRARRVRDDVALLAVLALTLLPLLVLGEWALRNPDPLTTLRAARDELVQSLGVAMGAAALIAVLGLLVARQSLRPRVGVLVLALALLPLAAPGVTVGLGQIRLWNDPANPLADAMYRSPALLVMSLAGRYLALGVLASRALLLRLDREPFEAARLAARPAPVRWWRVDLPLLAPALGLGALLGYVIAMRELDIVVLVPAGSGSLAHKIYSMVHTASDDTTALLCLAAVGAVLVPLAAARLIGVPGVDCGAASRPE